MQVKMFVIATSVTNWAATEVRRSFGLDAMKDMASGKGRVLPRGSHGQGEYRSKCRRAFHTRTS